MRLETEYPFLAASRERRVGWAAGAGVVANALAIDPWGLQPFGPLKVGVVAVAVLVAVALVLRSGIRLPTAPLLLWGLLLGWLLVAAVMAVDPLHAWIGTPDRRMGWFTWVLFALAWGVGTNLGAGSRLAARAAVVASGVLGLYALLELVGVAPVSMAFAGGRVGGPYGQPAYLGAAAALFTPVATGLAADRNEHRTWRAVGGITALLGTVALLGSGSRAAWFGAAVAAVVMVPRVWRWFRQRSKAGIVLAMLVVATLSVTPVGERALSVFDAGPDGAGSRIAEWEVAVSAVAERPVLGYGPEGYRIAFPGAVNADYVRTYGREVITDRAHSGVLDVVAVGGVPAGILYVALMGMIAYAAVRACRNGDPFRAGVGAGVLAYAVQQQLLFPTAEIDPVFWILAGTLFVHTPARSVTLRGSRAVAAVALCVTVAVIACSAAGVAADRMLASAADQAEVFPAHALHEADRATLVRPDSIHAWYVASQVAAAGPALTDIDRALDRASEGLARSPADPALRAEHAALLLDRAVRSGLDEDLGHALRTLDELVTDDPHNPAHRQQFARALELAGDDEAAAQQRSVADDLEKP